VALTSSAGVVVTEYRYEPFGQTTATGASSPNAFQFTGRENDGTGLFYYRFRFYSPYLQRFVTEDPTGFLGESNSYVYVGNNPLASIDPLGLHEVGVKSEEYQRICNFVRSSYNPAASVAKRMQIDVKTEFMLALTGHESYWGLSPAAQKRGNFAGMSAEKKDGGRELLKLGGFKPSIERLLTDRGRQLTSPSPVQTIDEFLGRLNSDRNWLYNAEGKGGKGDKQWRDKIKDKYNHILDALTDPRCQPPGYSGGGC
jgi:RHS repeat-associated protein